MRRVRFVAARSLKSIHIRGLDGALSLSPLMGDSIMIVHKEQERVSLLRLAKTIVGTARGRGRNLSQGEDAMVVELMKQAQALELEISRLQGISASPVRAVPGSLP